MITSPAQNLPPSIVWAKFSQTSGTFVLFVSGYSFQLCFGNLFMIKFPISNLKLWLGGDFESLMPSYILRAPTNHFQVSFCLCVKTGLYEKPFTLICVHLQVHFHVNQVTHFHLTNFALVLKQTHKVTRKWPILKIMVFYYSGDPQYWYLWQ